MKVKALMKRILRIFCPSLVLLACNQASISKPVTLIHRSQFDISTFPKDWVRLTKTDSGYIVYNSCDAGNLLLTINGDKKPFRLLLHGEQEDSEFEILESKVGMGDTLVLRTKWINSDERQDFKFCWKDREGKLGQWITKYSNGFVSDFVFVSVEGQNKFPRVDQSCKECWGDECDEMGKEEGK